MGCAASTPAPEPTKLESNPQKVSDEEMAQVRKSLAEAAEKAKEAPTTRQATFKRKFEGFKAGGGSKHNVRRAKDMSPEAVAEREKINAAISKKKADREAELAKMKPLQRSLSRGSDLGRSAKSVLTRMPTRSLEALVRMPSRGAGLVRQLTRGSSGSSGSSRSLLSSFTRKYRSAKDVNEANERASSAADAAAAMASGIHDHENAESFSKKTDAERSSASGKHARFAVPAPDLAA